MNFTFFYPIIILKIDLYYTQFFLIYFMYSNYICILSFFLTMLGVFICLWPSTLYLKKKTRYNKIIFMFHTHLFHYVCSLKLHGVETWSVGCRQIVYNTSKCGLGWKYWIQGMNWHIMKWFGIMKNSEKRTLRCILIVSLC